MWQALTFIMNNTLQNNRIYQDIRTQQSTLSARMQRSTADEDKTNHFKRYILRSNNYSVWKCHTLKLLKARGLLKTIEDDKDNDVQKEHQTWALLMSALSSKNRMMVVNCKTAFRVWKQLEAEYGHRTNFKKENLLNKIHEFKLESLSNLYQDVGKLESIIDELTFFGETILENQMVTIILKALPKSCESFTNVWKKTAQAEHTVDNLLSKLIEHKVECLLHEARTLVNKSKLK